MFGDGFLDPLGFNGRPMIDPSTKKALSRGVSWLGVQTDIDFFYQQSWTWCPDSRITFFEAGITTVNLMEV